MNDKLLSDILEVIKAMAQDRREQSAQFHQMMEAQNRQFHDMMTAQNAQFLDLLNRQAAAISDSEARIGNINTMVNNLFGIVSSKERQSEANSNIAQKALNANEGLRGELHTLVALLEERSKEEVHSRKTYDEVLEKILAHVTQGGRSENHFEIK